MICDIERATFNGQIVFLSVETLSHNVHSFKTRALRIHGDFGISIMSKNMECTSHDSV